MNETLRTLSLTNCEITDMGLASSMDALQLNNTLRRLKLLGNNALTMVGMLHFLHHKSGQLCVNLSAELIVTLIGKKSEYNIIAVGTCPYGA